MPRQAFDSLQSPEPSQLLFGGARIRRGQRTSAGGLRWSRSTSEATARRAAEEHGGELQRVADRVGDVQSGRKEEN